MPHGVWVWVLPVLAIAVLVGVGFLLQRRHYLTKVRALGWSHDSHPTMAAVAELQAPPLGLGIGRSVDELVSGRTAGGFAFRVFEYGYSGAGPQYSERLASLELPFALPDAFLSDPATVRSGVGIGGLHMVQAEDHGVRVIAGDGELAGDLLGSVGNAVAGFAQATGTLDLGIDGNHLVASGAPKAPDRLAAFLAALDEVAGAIAGSASLAARQVPHAPASWYYGHPDWSYIGTDDDVLGHYPVSTGGYGHRTEDVVRGLRDGIRLDAFTHHWKSDHIETYTDGNGDSHTRTVTEHHSEPVCGFALPFSLPTLSVNGARVGDRVRFESSDFNDAFTVRTEEPKFASDVIHPRTMEWLLAVRPRGWSVYGSIVAFEVEEHDLLIVDACAEVLRGWLGRIPRFVWQDRQLPCPPYLIE